MTRPALPRTSEKAEQAAIVKLLRSVGAHVYPLSQPRATMQAEGLPDLWVFLPHSYPDLMGNGIWVEVKARGGKLRPAQERFKNLCDEFGVLHVVAFGLDGMIEYLKEAGLLK